MEDEIKLLEDEIIELRFQLKSSKDKEMIYLDILSNINLSLKKLLKEEEENIRFNFDDKIDYKECVNNLNKSMNEYIRLYKLRL